MHAIARETNGEGEGAATAAPAAAATHAAGIMSIATGGCEGIACINNGGNHGGSSNSARKAATTKDTSNDTTTNSAQKLYPCPRASRVLTLLFHWSSLDILGGPTPALPETSVASTFKRAARNCGLASAASFIPSPHSTDGNCGPASAPTATEAKRVRLRRQQLRPCVDAVAVAARMRARLGLPCC